MKETKSNWACVADTLMQEVPDISLGPKTSECFYKTPEQLLDLLSYYKFAAKLIGKDKRILDLSCGEGLGTFLVGKECGFSKGVDSDQEAITQAQSNFKEPFVAFQTADYLGEEKWDATICLDSDKALESLPNMADLLLPEGLTIIGSPNTADQTHKELEGDVKKYFECVFTFSAYDELINAGYSPFAQYIIVLGCKKKS